VTNTNSLIVMHAMSRYAFDLWELIWDHYDELSIDDRGAVEYDREHILLELLPPIEIK